MPVDAIYERLLTKKVILVAFSKTDKAPNYMI